MKVSVVVPTHNRSGMVARAIVSLTEQTLAPMEIIVVDNGSTDDTAAVLHDLRSRFRRLRHIREPELGVSIARNRGAGEASGQLVAFLDDDAVAGPHWLEALADAAASSPGAAGFAGPIGLRWTRQAPRWVRGLEGWYGHFDLGSTRTKIDYPLYPFASNVAFRREAFLSVGGFPSELGPRGVQRIGCEEDGLFRRVAARGWDVIYEPEARVYHWVHPERLSRRYLLRRGVTQGTSKVLVDALFAGSRTRSERLRRSVGAAGDAVGAGRLALRRGSDGTAMHALVAASENLGSAIGDARQAAVLRRQPRRDPPGAPGPIGLSIEQHDQFARDGFVRIPGAFDEAVAMEDRMWAFLARRGVLRDDPATWPIGEARHLQKLLDDPVFMPIGGPVTTAVADDLLGVGRWGRPNHWGEFLVTFPYPERRWMVPPLWHTDADYVDPLEPLRGLMVFSFLNDVAPRGGATLVVAGSHRLVARFASNRPGIAEEASAASGKAFYRSHPWLQSLLGSDDDPRSYDHLFAEADIDGLPARVVELTAQAGDVVVAHPLLAHTVSPNCGAQPRFMRITRLRVR
ncbi:MAG: hypothetical protein QOE35_3788 [Actinomycetota bacterium]|jgi:GT2 family glycosyltransferase